MRKCWGFSCKLAQEGELQYNKTYNRRSLDESCLEMPKPKTRTPNAADLLHIHPSLHSLATPVDQIKLDPNNARMGHDLEGIAKSIQMYGQRTPLVVNTKEGGAILKGNGTYQAMTDILGLTWVAAIKVEDDPNRADGYALADNRLTDLSFFDPDAVVKVLLQSGEEVPGMDTLVEMLREIQDENIDHLLGEEVEVIPVPTVTIIFDLPQDIYDRYAYLHMKLDEFAEDEIIFARMLAAAEKALL